MPLKLVKGPDGKHHLQPVPLAPVSIPEWDYSAIEKKMLEHYAAVPPPLLKEGEGYPNDLLTKADLAFKDLAKMGGVLGTISQEAFNQMLKEKDPKWFSLSHAASKFGKSLAATAMAETTLSFKEMAAKMAEVSTSMDDLSVAMDLGTPDGDFGVLSEVWLSPPKLETFKAEQTVFWKMPKGDVSMGVWGYPNVAFSDFDDEMVGWEPIASCPLQAYRKGCDFAFYNVQKQVQVVIKHAGGTDIFIIDGKTKKFKRTVPDLHSDWEIQTYAIEL